MFKRLWCLVCLLSISIIFNNCSAVANPLLPFTAGAITGNLVTKVDGPKSDIGYSDFAIALTPAKSDGDQGQCVYLTRKFISRDDKIQQNYKPVLKGQVYEVILKKLKLGSDSNSLGDIQDKLSGHFKFAVVVKGFEMSNSGKPVADQGFDFTPTSADSGRVVYYSDDVKVEQELDFSSIRMFPPAAYHGNPVGVTMYAFKLAGDTNELSGMMSSLANMGKSTTNSPIISGVLEALGTKLLEGENKKVMRYDAMLGPEFADPSFNNLFASKLMYADYVIIRREDRKSIEWNDLLYNPKEGVVYHKPDNTDQSKTWVSCGNKTLNENSYAIIQVAPANVASSMYYQQFSELQKAIDAAPSNLNLAKQHLAKAHEISSISKDFETLESLAGYAQSKQSPPYALQVDIRKILEKIHDSAAFLRNQSIDEKTAQIETNIKEIEDKAASDKNYAKTAEILKSDLKQKLSSSDYQKENLIANDKFNYPINQAAKLLDMLKIIVADKYPPKPNSYKDENPLNRDSIDIRANFVSEMQAAINASLK